MKNKIYDCITFFNENYIFDLRYNILKDYVDGFVICESKYDHKGNLKNINFSEKNKIKSSKIKYILLDEPFPTHTNPWKNQAIQREFLLSNLNFIHEDDYVFFSDPDEIPNPEILKRFQLNKKYGIFRQKCFNYKFNLYNSYENPWEGTRVCKKKNLKSIDFMRQKVRIKNLKYNFYRFDKEKSIEIFDNGGWHFNNILEPEDISIKLKTFAHTEFLENKFSSIEIIKKKIDNKIDLFERGHVYKKIELDNSFPKYLIENKELYKKFIL